MTDERLAAYSAIVPDPPDTEVPLLDYEEEQSLNRQTAYNRRLLGSAEMCGCFHCGRRFPTSLVTEWMAEDGEDTGLCPYCGVDALVVGDGEHPLTTSLLTTLYERWFHEERDERWHSAIELPPFANWEDYARRGNPFSWKMREGRRIVAEAMVFNVGAWDGPDEYDEDGFPTHVFGLIGDEEPRGVWHVRGPWGEDGAYVGFELVGDDGGTVPFEPWGDRDRGVVEGLVAKHGNALLAEFKGPSFDRLQLFVEDTR